MKTVLLLSFVCNQTVYDEVYKGIIQQSLREQITLNTRADSIEKLRALCRGQKSSYEMDGGVK